VDVWHRFKENAACVEFQLKGGIALKIILAICLLLTGMHGAIAASLTGRVVGVSDGDTITVLDAEKVQHKVRLMGVDSPEKAQPFGQKAKQHLSDLVFDRSVTVEWQKQDRYQRIVGKVMVNGQDVNLDQVRQGLAWHYKQFEREQDPLDRAAYAQAEILARQGNRGLWSDSAPIPPWDWRKSKK
jgi:endonuclease YncB( thermonuclease family)